MNQYREYRDQMQDEQYNDEYDDIDFYINKNGEDSVSNIKTSFSQLLIGFSQKKNKILIILLTIIIIFVFLGMSYYSKRFGEGETSAYASGYLLDKEVEIKEKENNGYYYTLGKDIVERYKKALNEAYDKGEHDKEWLDTLKYNDTENYNKKTSTVEASTDKVEFNDQIFEEWFQTEDRKLWEPYLVKMFTTEIASAYPKLGDYEGEEKTEDRQGTKKDENGDYVVQGKAEIQRTKIRINGTEGETIKLKYIPEKKLDELIEANNLSALDYFSLDETSGYLYYASWTKVENISMGFNSTISSDAIINQEKYILRKSYIQYENYISSFIMPYNFLEALLQTSGNPEYVMAVANLIQNNTEIILMIQDQLKINKETEMIGKTIGMEYENTSNVFIKKAKTWCTDYEDDAQIDVSKNNSKYTNKNGREVNKATTTYKFKIKSASDKKIVYEKFLGLWKNKAGIYSYGVLYDATGKEVSYKLPPEFTESSYPVDYITGSESQENINELTDLLSRYKNTQTHDKLMKYFWNIYTEKNVYDVDINSILKQSNTGKFKTTIGASVSNYSLPQKLWIEMLNAGFNQTSASTIVAAAIYFDQLEFKNSPENVLGISEEEYAKRVDNGTYTNFIDDGICFGVGKWTTPKRKKGLLDYAKSKGKSINDADIQIAYLIAELDLSGTSDASTFATYQLGAYGDSWKQADTIEKAIDIYYRACIKDIENMIIGKKQTEGSESTGWYMPGGNNTNYTVEQIVKSTKDKISEMIENVNIPIQTDKPTSTISQEDVAQVAKSTKDKIAEMIENANIPTSTTTADAEQIVKITKDKIAEMIKNVNIPTQTDKPISTISQEDAAQVVKSTKDKIAEIIKNVNIPASTTTVDAEQIVKNTKDKIAEMIENANIPTQTDKQISTISQEDAAQVVKSTKDKIAEMIENANIPTSTTTADAEQIVKSIKDKIAEMIENANIPTQTDKTVSTISQEDAAKVVKSTKDKIAEMIENANIPASTTSTVDAEQIVKSTKDKIAEMIENANIPIQTNKPTSTISQEDAAKVVKSTKDKIAEMIENANIPTQTNEPTRTISQEEAAQVVKSTKDRIAQMVENINIPTQTNEPTSTISQEDAAKVVKSTKDQIAKIVENINIPTQTNEPTRTISKEEAAQVVKSTKDRIAEMIENANIPTQTDEPTSTISQEDASKIVKSTKDRIAEMIENANIPTNTSKGNTTSKWTDAQKEYAHQGMYDDKPYDTPTPTPTSTQTQNLIQDELLDIAKGVQENYTETVQDSPGQYDDRVLETYTDSKRNRIRTFKLA